MTDGFDETTNVLKAMAHPSRLHILIALSSEDEACVGHLEHLLGIQQAPLSQHLAKLRDAGLVLDRREGTNIYYSLIDRCLGQLLEITQSTVQLLVFTRGETVTYELPRGDQSTDCPCPRCA